MDEQTLFDNIERSLSNAYADTGFRAPEKSLYDDLCNGVTDYLIEKMPLFDVRNIEKAIQNGILGEYGDYMGLSKVSFVKFLKSYQAANQPVKTNRDMTPLKAKPLLPDQFNTAKENIQYAFNARKDGKDIQRAAAMNYDFLVSIGLCIYEKEVKQVIWREAIHFTIGQQQEKKAVADLFARDAINKLIDTFNAGPDPESKEFNTIVINAKYLTLCKYFDDSILSGTDISKLVESKREVFYNKKQA